MNLETVNPDTARTLTAAHIRCQCGRYIYPYRAPRRAAEGTCAVCAGTRRAAHNGREIVEDAAFLATHGTTLASAAQRLHITEGALERALYRHHRGDLARKLRGNQ